MKTTGREKGLFVCPACQTELAEKDLGLQCDACSSVYQKNGYGYFEITIDKTSYDIVSTTDEYASDQIEKADRVFDEYLMPYLKKEPFAKVLDVGCGVGRYVARLRNNGYEAYGFDLPSVSRFWKAKGNDPSAFISGNVSKMPFKDDCFDVVYSLGVVEHIGTTDGHAVLTPEYKTARRAYAGEILRVAKPGGRIVIACPNKAFPVDLHHGHHEGLRGFVFHKTGLNFHRTWGTNHLLSFGEIKELFCGGGGGGRSIHPLPLKGYFGFGKFEKGLLKPFAFAAKYYCNHLPAVMRKTFANPYVLVEIKK